MFLSLNVVFVLFFYFPIFNRIVMVSVDITEVVLYLEGENYNIFCQKHLNRRINFTKQHIKITIFKELVLNTHKL